MSWAIVAGLGGGLLAAGGSIGGAAIQGEQAQGPDPRRPGVPLTFDPTVDPLTALATADVLSSFGIDPTSLLSNVGPLQRAIEAFQGTEPVGARRRDRSRRQQDIQDFMAGRNTGGAQRIAQAGGFGSVAEAHSAQQQFQTSLSQVLPALQQTADLARSRGLSVEQQLGRVAEGFAPLDFESLRESESARLAQGLDDRRREALRAANVGGFNPGGSLEALERERTNADTQAIMNAISLLSGQSGAIGQQIGTLQALDPRNRAQSLAGQTAGMRQIQFGGATQTPSVGTDPFGAAVASAGQQLGGTIASIPQLQQNQQTNALLLELTRQRIGGPATG